MVEWRVYGCGSPSSFRSTQSSYEIADNGKHLQVDLGHGAVYRRCCRVKNIETVVESMHHVLLTHCHPDHCIDLTRLYVAWKYTPGFKASQPVQLHATERTIEAIQRMMDNIRLEEGFGEVFVPCPFRLEEPFELEGIRIHPRRTKHIGGSCGFLFETSEGKRIGFTSDTGYFDEISDIWNDADLLIIECSFFELETPYHLYLEQVAEIAEKINPEALVLVHFYPDMENQDDDVIRDVLKRRYQGDIFLAEDGMAIKWDSSAKKWMSEMMF